MAFCKRRGLCFYPPNAFEMQRALELILSQFNSTNMGLEVWPQCKSERKLPPLDKLAAHQD